MKTGIGIGIALFGLACVVLRCAGCHPPAPGTEVENAAAVAQYKALLVDCRARGKAARDYAVYEACADAVDAMLCAQRSLRCTDGGAP
jgi:hypothetical protein